MIMSEQEIIDIVHRQRTFFNTAVTHAYNFRFNKLLKLKSGIEKFESKLSAALKDDLGRPDFEIYAS